jgi:hypothetical protein
MCESERPAFGVILWLDRNSTNFCMPSIVFEDFDGAGGGDRSNALNRRRLGLSRDVGCFGVASSDVRRR